MFRFPLSQEICFEQGSCCSLGANLSPRAAINKPENCGGRAGFKRERERSITKAQVGKERRKQKAERRGKERKGEERRGKERRGKGEGRVREKKEGEGKREK